jgi:hypothetical protein
MRRMLLLAALVLLPTVAARAEAGPSKEFKAKNFKWTLPSDDWAFVEPTSEQKTDGYVAGVECKEDGGIKAFARVVNDGPTADAVAEEVRRAFGQGLKKVGQSAVTRGSLSGIPGSLVVLSGTAEGGGTLWFRGYAATVGKTLYQVLIEAYNGAEGKRGKEIDAMKRGFRLLADAGPEEEPTEIGALEEAGKVPPGGADAGGGGTFPPNGPKLEGRTAIFPSHNLRWTLPEGSPFTWQSVTANEKEPAQLLVSLRSEVARKDAKDLEPKVNRCTVALSVRPLELGVTSALVVNDAGLQESIRQNVFDGKPDASKTKIDLDRKVGNYQGSSITMAGGVDKSVHWFIFLAVCLKSERYSFEVNLEGGRDVRETFGQALGALLGGVEFVDTKEHVRGPLAVDGVLSHNAARGHSADKEIEFTVPGLTGKKPKGLAAIAFEGGADPNLRAAYEARSADGQTYFYFDVHTYDAQTLQRENKKPEDLVKERETKWRTSAGESTTTVAKGKEPYFDSSFAGIKGLGYEFTGSLGGHPFVEQGWVIKAKNNILWLRLQLGGTGADKSMDTYVKAMKRAKPQ